MSEGADRLSLVEGGDHVREGNRLSLVEGGGHGREGNRLSLACQRDEKDAQCAEYNEALR